MRTYHATTRYYAVIIHGLTTARSALLALGLLVVICSCSTVQRPTDPEYQGAVPIGDNDYVVDMDFDNDEWVMTLTRQVSSVKGAGEHTPHYRMVNNVTDAAVCAVDDTLFVSSPKEGILRSINQGITFEVVSDLDSLGKATVLLRHGNEFVALRANKQVVHTVNRKAWKPLAGLQAVQATGRVGTNILFVSDSGVMHILDASFTLRRIDGIILPSSSRPVLSTDETISVVLAGSMLYRVRETASDFRVDSTPLPSDRDWRAVSVLGENIVLLAGRNEVWWGTFEEPMQVQSEVTGDKNKRIVGIELTNIGLVAGFRGTEHSVFMNIKNSNDWEGLYRIDGRPVNDVLWLSRSSGTVVIGTREGGMYRVATNRRALLDVGSPANEMNILSVHGTYPDKLVTMYDGRILRISKSKAEPTLISTPVQHTNSMQVLDAGPSAWYVQDPTTGLYTSSDRGTSWTRMSVTDSIGYLEVLYGMDDHHYAFGSRRLWYSQNNGSSWNAVFEPSDTVYTAQRIGEELLVYTAGGWRFVRNGRVTGEMSAPVRAEDSRVFIFDASESVIAILTESYLYVSNDRGKSWGSLKMSRESMFPYVRVSNDRVFSPLPGMGLMMFDVYSDRPQPAPAP